MNPLVRYVVIGVVGMLFAGGLVALAFAGGNPDLSVMALVAAGIIGAVIGLFLYAQGWAWSSRAARGRETGSALLIALGGGLMALVAAVALAGLAVLALLFFLG